jgi:hypothetical protein
MNGLLLFRRTPVPPGSAGETLNLSRINSYLTVRSLETSPFSGVSNFEKIPCTLLRLHATVCRTERSEESPKKLSQEAEFLGNSHLHDLLGKSHAGASVTPFGRSHRTGVLR